MPPVVRQARRRIIPVRTEPPNGRPSRAHADNRHDLCTRYHVISSLTIAPLRYCAIARRADSDVERRSGSLHPWAARITLGEHVDGGTDACLDHRLVAHSWRCESPAR